MNTTTETKSLESLNTSSISNDKEAEIYKLTKLQNKFNKLDNLYIDLDKNNSTNHSTPTKEDKKILNKINIIYKSNDSSFDEDNSINEEILSEEKRGCCFNCTLF